MNSGTIFHVIHLATLQVLVTALPLKTFDDQSLCNSGACQSPSPFTKLEEENAQKL